MLGANSPSLDAAARLHAIDWVAIGAELDARGCAVVPELLDPEVCRGLIALYPDAQRFRSRVVMGRHGYGQGEYQYFDEPLPEPVESLRREAYPRLVPIANAWSERLGVRTGKLAPAAQCEPLLRGALAVDAPPSDPFAASETPRFPATLAALREACRAAGQSRPTPLLLKYGPGDYNCLHQDLYGPLVFPLQLAVLLSEPGRDFAGGEFVLTEQRPRMQSRVEVVPLSAGDAVIFATRERPVAGTRGDYRVNMRHGVSRIRHGARYTLGVIFHDAF